MTITMKINAHDLHAWLKPVDLMFDRHTAYTADMMPALGVVQIRHEGDALTAFATDRYRMPLSRLRLSAVEAKGTLPGAVHLRHADLRRLLLTFLPGRAARTSKDVTVILRQDRVVVDDGQVRFGVPTAQDVNLPDLDTIRGQLIGRATTARTVHVNPALIAPWLAYFNRGRVTMTAVDDDVHKPILFTFTDDFVAAVMPMRPGDNDDRTELGWIAPKAIKA